MKTAGEVTRADILQTPDGRSKGCGIVEFATAEEASNAVATLNDSELMGRQIFVREDREAEKAADASSKRVYVGNLAYGVAWQDLKDHMRDAGDVQYAEVMMMNDGRSKGCGIVEFVTAEAAKNAIETMNDTELGGRQIFVREDREQKVAGGGGGGGQHGGQHHGGGGGWNRVGGGGGAGGGRNNNHWGNVSVYVGNLAYETTWQELKDHMRRVGNIDKVNTLFQQDCCPYHRLSCM
jgi:RNA recognition motif-containing protein